MAKLPIGNLGGNIFDGSTPSLLAGDPLPAELQKAWDDVLLVCASGELPEDRVLQRLREAVAGLDESDKIRKSWLFACIENVLEHPEILSRYPYARQTRESMMAQSARDREQAFWRRNSNPITLARLSDSPDWDIARGATERLREYMDDLVSCPSPQEELLQFLEYDKEPVRLMAAENLVRSAKTGNFESDPAGLVMRLLDMHDSAVHELVAEECTEILDDGNVDILRPYFDDENISFKWKLAESVERIGGEKAAWTLQDYKARESRRRQELIRGYISELDNPETVAVAAANLGVFDDEAAIAIQPLLRVLRESDNGEARAEAAQSIGNIGVSDSDSVAALSHAATHDFQSAVREAAINALAKRAQDSAGVVETFIHALEHDTPDIRATAALALDTCKGNPDRAVYALISALERESDYTVRSFAIASLGRLMTAKAAKALIDYLHDANTELCLAAARALAAGEPHAEIVVPALIESLADGRFIEHRDMAWYENVCDAVGESLVEIGSPAADMLKRAASEHPDQSIRDEASRLYAQVRESAPGH